MENIAVLYEDVDILVINKPSGLLVHADRAEEQETVAHWLINKYPEVKGVGEPMTIELGGNIIPIERWGIVHRLDKDTSGVLLLAKTERGYKRLKKQFQRREIKKQYRAFVYGTLKEKEGTINRPIQKSTQHIGMWTAQRGGRGVSREAETAYRVLFETSEASLLDVRPLTGRTHQIRVHLKAKGHPIVADPLYAPDRETLLGFTRLALHAYKIKFKDSDDVEHEIEAPLPEDFVAAEKGLRQFTK